MKHILRLTLAVLGSIALSNAFAWPYGDDATPVILSSDQAFQVTPPEWVKGGVATSIYIAPGTFLYQNKLSVVVEHDGQVTRAVTAPGQPRHDRIYGEVSVYTPGLLEIAVPVPHTATAGARVTIRFQGCSDAGVCYPPQVRSYLMPREAGTP